MDNTWLSRTELLIGNDALQKLNNAHVLIVGMGGVGSFAAEFICRSGVGKMTIIDGDCIEPSNRNRQLPALATNHGSLKVDVMKERLLYINPELQINAINMFVYPDNVESMLTPKPDFIIDAIDSITPKLTFISTAMHFNIPIVSSMGAGGKLDPTMLHVTDISKTFNCPFAQQIRKQLRKQYNIRNGLTVVFSPEENVKNSLMHTTNTRFKKSAYGTISYMPATFGSVCASVAIRHIIDSTDELTVPLFA